MKKKLPYNPPNVTGGGIKLRNYVSNKKVIYWFPITTYTIK
jgi:hypothetical protein